MGARVGPPRPVSSGCTPTRATFDTVAEDHGNCSVGRFTHGFAEAADILDKSDVAALLDVGWVTMEAFTGVAALCRGGPRACAMGRCPRQGRCRMSFFCG